MEHRALPLILISVAVSAAAGAIAAIAVAPSAPVQAEGANRDDAARISAALDKLAARQGELEHTLSELRDAAASSNARSEVVDVDAAIERWMQAHSPQLAAHAKGDEIAAAGSQKSREQRIADAFARLQDGHLSDVERQRLWREFAKEGLSDALIAEYERRTESDPTNPDLKVDCAQAYFMKINEVGASAEAGMWATKADTLLDSALAIDDHHWDARFTKAVALSFWPAFLGKQKEAASQLEILVAQQAEQPKEEKFARTHLILGNMYQQLGQGDKAVAAWQVGIAQFPNDADLKKQLDLYGAH